MGKSALVMWGGWNGHTPKKTAEILAGKLKENGFDVRIENALKPLEDVEAMKKLNLIVPMWTMGDISNEQWNGLNQAIHDAGVGIAGVHGGMGDAFRGHGVHDVPRSRKLASGSGVLLPGGRRPDVRHGPVLPDGAREPARSGKARNRFGTHQLPDPHDHQRKKERHGDTGGSADACDGHHGLCQWRSGHDHHLF